MSILFQIRELLMNDYNYTNDLGTLQTWVGRTQEHTEVISAAHCNLLELTLDRTPTLDDQDPLPPLWHFITHLDSETLSNLGPDGHPKRGGFLPPVALPRRMWAGGRISFTGKIRLGDEVTKLSTVEKVEMKEGRTGSLCFVTVKHELLIDEEVRITEEQDLVYREDPAPDAPKPSPKPAPDEAQFSRTITPSEVMLFRYSALTFNSHRIHYDREYARNAEGYQGLVFHGPLTATLLADLAVRETGKRLASFSFRGLAPLFDDEPFTISGTREGSELSLWASTPSGGLAMQASATIEYLVN